MKKWSVVSGQWSDKTYDPRVARVSRFFIRGADAANHGDSPYAVMS